MLGALLGLLVAPLPIRGADMSFVPQYAPVVAYQDGGKLRDPIESLTARGLNLLRVRVWVNPPDGRCGLPEVLGLAKRAKKLGLKLLIDFHYSDHWADPQHQDPPEAWLKMNPAQMAKAVGKHTRTVLDALVAQGTPPQYVQIGNEVRDGMLWPSGQIKKSGYDHFAAYLKAGIAEAARTKPRPLIMIHHDQGGNPKMCRAFYSELARRGVKWDLIGLSYYPWWHGTFDELRANLATLAESFGKPIWVVETAYPFTLGFNDRTGNFVGLKSQLMPGYDATPAGQAKFLRDLAAIVARTPKGLGQGIVYWAPEYVAAPGLGTPYENLALWDFDAEILPGADALGGR